MKIKVKFLGSPEIYINEHKVVIHQKKIQALFLYLLFNMSCTRDELVFVFWCDYDECSAKRNLRNSIYKLKKYIGEQIIITKGNTYVQINPNMDITRDIDVFISENNENKLLDLKEHIFLDKFYIKGCAEFENWVVSIRGVYENMLIDRLKSGLKNSIKINDENYIEKYAKKLISIDPCNEMACRNLMKVYAKKGLYNEAIRQFNKLAKLLKKELDVEPEEETYKLYEKILKMKTIKNEYKNDSIYYCRLEEVTLINEEYRKFVSSDNYCNCVVCGDMGSGKTTIINNFIKGNSIRDYLELEFKIPNENIKYYAVEIIIREFLQKFNIQLPKTINKNFQSEGIYYIKIIQYIIDHINEINKKIVLILKNVEFIDKESLEIIISTLLNKRQKIMFIVIEYCQNYRNDYETIANLEAESNIKLLKLDPLSEQETAEYISSALKDKINSNIDIRNIYNNTQGNLMLLQDILIQIDNKENIEFIAKKNSINRIRQMYTSFDKIEVEYLEIISIFKNGVEVSALAEILQKSILEILNIVDKLYNKGLIEESKIENHLVLKIRPNLIRKIIYDNMGNYKKLELHRLAARFYENKYLVNKKDYFYISELQYHFNLTNNEYEKVYYGLVYLEYKLDYCDEFFPTLKNYEHSPSRFYMNKERIYEEFKIYETMLNSIEDYCDTDKLYELKMRFNFLMGRTLNRHGQKEKGIHYIRELIEQALKLNRKDFLLKGYLETIYYGLKKENKDLMAEYILKAKDIVNNGNDYEVEKGILFRLEGLCNIMNRNYKKAEELLWKSINLFNTPRLRDTNFINTAAAYAYLGYSYRNKGEYNNAEKYLKKAIDICLEKNIKKSLDLFYEDLGYVYFLKKEYEEAEKCFEKSIELYDMFGTYWLRSIAESCMSMINLHKGNKDKALEYYRRAEIFSKKESVEEEMIVLEMAKKQLKEKNIL